MSQFLGRQDCIDSLRKDLVDLQGAILDVFSRTGPVRFSSWKFPDKLSCSLDMVALLEQYDFVDGEDAFSQHSHIVLLELVIDRLLLLLQSFSAYVEQLRGRREQTQPKGCLSVGLVVRSYWSNLVQFATTKEACNYIKKQTKTKTFNDEETKTVSPASSQMSSRSDSCRHCLSASSSASTFTFSPQNHLSSSPTHNTPHFPIGDSHNVGCQTIESSLIPCNACHQVQSLLRKTGDALVDLFQSEGLPSSLQPLSAAVADTVELGHMTAGDVAQWANEQLRDMRRLAKHLQDVRGTVQPLKDRLAAAETEQERYRSLLHRLQKEFKEKVEKHQQNTVQLEFSLHKAERSMKETEQRLQKEHQQLMRETLSLEERNSKLQEEVALQQDTLQALEYEKNELQERVKTLQTEEEVCCKLQHRIKQLESEISDSQLLLDKENAKYQSACRQQESMRAKQKSLLERVDGLDEECEELQRQLGEREDRQINLHNQLQHLSEEKDQLQAQLTQQQDLCFQLQKEKQMLETDADLLKNCVAELKESVKALRERERLLVAFPELTPLAQAQPQSTGNVLLDMEQQLQANSMRIKVLEQENATLQRSLEKLRERTQHNATGEASPQQTWSGLLQSSSAARLGYSNTGKEPSGGESGLESAEPEDRVSASPSSLKIHFQTLHLNTAATRHTQIRSASLLSHSRGLNVKKK
ncbi:coiled-coil domain-containing protein 157 isoform X2 [Acanthochromis polyacanthus]|uniref:coiled-coil domain-containing protein 157 isoform X2 n=1 Tax=Acanthochromis polyacanthus TaxID=80966 RepID=UPI002234E985|nr:coiled-coil domain-containing protein 157 isoform X2 [Acanthochromis polyacanthus]